MPSRTAYEAAEIERSAIDASKRPAILRVSPKQMARYLDPHEDTSFPLEYAFYLLGDVRGKLVLDYGCGAGESAMLLAARKAYVTAIDISPRLIQLAKKSAVANGFHVDFRVGSAYETGLPDASVDIVFGQAILHHLLFDLDAARLEVLRILKPNGILILQEPVRDSRLLAFLRRFIPYSQNDVSPSERPLRKSELDSFCEGLSVQAARRFRLPFVPLALLLAPKKWREIYNLDCWLLTKFPFLARYASIEVRKAVRS